MFDTHCHLNLSRFKKNVDEVIQGARNAGVNYLVMPGTNLENSQKAIEIAAKNEDIYAGVGIHPHHAYEMKENAQDSIDVLLEGVEKIITLPKVVAVGEIGMDRHIYENTKYKDYNIDDHFVETQKKLFKGQALLAIKHKKSLIVHNREAKGDLLPILEEIWDSHLEGRAVFHCCEPDEELLNFAKEHKMFVGVDGDITYFKEKQEHIKKVPLEMLVLETDSPFLLPEPLRSQKLFPNKPENLKLIGEFIAQLKGVSFEELDKVTTVNAKKLFQIS